MSGQLRRICVYCGSNPGKLQDYVEAARALGEAMASRGIALVYGGASVGVMGAVADAALAEGAEVIGVIPESLATREVAHAGLSKLHVVHSMHERKSLMADLSDGFIALPGGWGTFEEIFEALTWAQLGFHAKPCGLLNVRGYFDHLAAFLEHAIEQQFVKDAYRPMITLESDADSLLDSFAAYKAPVVKKWIGEDET